MKNIYIIICKLYLIIKFALKMVGSEKLKKQVSKKMRKSYNLFLV